LIGHGNVSQSFFYRLSALHTRLGPIKGTTFPWARRLTVSLRAGKAVSDYSDFGSCSAVWIVAPESSLDLVTQDFVKRTAVRKLPIVVCGTLRESTSFEQLRAHGGRIATLNSVDDVWQSSFIAEGHRETLNQIREILSKDKRRCIELGPGAKEKYLAGIHMVTELLRPWTSSAVELMSAAGLSRSEAAALCEAFASRSLRAYSKIGVKVWPPGVKKSLKEAQERAERMLSHCPREARLYAEGIRLALEYFDRGPVKNVAASNHQ
jgi:hypothetical protein